MKQNCFQWLLLLAWVCAFAMPAQAGQDQDAARALVAEAVAFVEKNGKEAAVAEFNKAEGSFVRGPLYVFAYDQNGVMLAHPKNPKLVGKNLTDVPDANGKFFRREIIEVAKSKGEGWVDYLYKNPDTSAMEEKTTYVRRAGDLVICAGAYKGR